MEGLASLRVSGRAGAVVLGLACLCGCGGGDAVPVPAVAVTNRVTVTVTVTNTVTVTEHVTVTNTVIERREPERALTARKTAAYLVSTRNMGMEQLRKLLSASGARLLACEPGALATVEAPDGVVDALRVGGVVDVRELTVADKTTAELRSAKAPVPVRIVPLSSIDVAAVTAAVREAGGELVQVVTSGSPAIRAKLDGVSICKLAGRADVRRMERDGK